MKKHKPLFNEECSKLLDHRNKAKLQRLQDPRDINWDNLNNVGHEAIGSEEQQATTRS
jgi:hypothetical protein